MALAVAVGDVDGDCVVDKVTERLCDIDNVPLSVVEKVLDGEVVDGRVNVGERDFEIDAVDGKDFVPEAEMVRDELGNELSLGDRESMWEGV